MNCIIVDDDLLTCKILEGYVSKSTSLNLVGVFSDSVAARDVFNKTKGYRSGYPRYPDA